MVLIPVLCPHCQSDQVIKGGTTNAGTQRYRCQNANCPHASFVLNPSYQGHLPEVKEHIIDMALNGSGIRDTARVLRSVPLQSLTSLKKSVGTQLCESTCAQSVKPGRGDGEDSAC